MADPYSDLALGTEEMQERIAAAMAARCQAPEQIAIRRAYLEGLDLPEGALAVEFCGGTGHGTCDRADRKAFFGFMSFVSLIAHKTGASA